MAMMQRNEMNQIDCTGELEISEMRDYEDEDDAHTDGAHAGRPPLPSLGRLRGASPVSPVCSGRDGADGIQKPEDTPLCLCA